MKNLSMRLLLFAAAVSVGFLATEMYRAALTARRDRANAESARAKAVQPIQSNEPAPMEALIPPPPTPPSKDTTPAERQLEYFRTVRPEELLDMQNRQLDEFRKRAENNPDNPDALSKEEIDQMAREGRIAW